MTSAQPPEGRIVRTISDGLPILWTFVPEMPAAERRKALPWLTVISWKYDGTSNNGMPDTATNDQMLALDAVLSAMERPETCAEAYRRIGKNLREFVLYVSAQETFLAELNERLASQPTYPIEITLYPDEEWSDLKILIDDLGQA